VSLGVNLGKILMDWVTRVTSENLCLFVLVRKRDSGVTKVGVTGAATEDVTSVFFPKK